MLRSLQRSCCCCPCYCKGSHKRIIVKAATIKIIKTATISFFFPIRLLASHFFSFELALQTVNKRGTKYRRETQSNRELTLSKKIKDVTGRWWILRSTVNRESRPLPGGSIYMFFFILNALVTLLCAICLFFFCQLFRSSGGK